MPSDIFFEIHQGLPREGPGRNEYTRRAFHMLPPMEDPHILDIGCGTWVPTVELAPLSQGHVIGLDTHQPCLDELTKREKEAGLSARIKASNCSMFEVDFPDESFDIIWAEGSIFVIGFERGLGEWRRFIKPNGFLVVHEMTWLRPDPPHEIYEYWQQLYSDIRNVSENLERIPACGYDLVGHFTLPEDAWWTEYYGPLQIRIRKLCKKYVDDPEALEVVEKEQREIDLFKKYHLWYGSAFFVMRKT